VSVHPSVRPVSVQPATTGKIVSPVLDRYAPNLEHSFHLTSLNTIFEQPLKWAWPRSRDPLNFSALNGNSYKTVKATDLKFYARFQGQSGHDSLKIFRKGGVARVVIPKSQWALNANSSKTAKDTDFRFDVHISRNSPDMMP